MDIKNIKNKLIIILLILNISLLGLYYYQNHSRRAYKIDQLVIEDLKERLEKNNIKLDVEIPERNKNLKALIVKYEEETPEDINRRYFQNSGKITDSKDAKRISIDQEEVNIINNRRILYDNLVENPSSQNTKDREEIAKNFLIDRGYNVDNLRLTKHILEDEEQGLYLLEYVKTYGDYLVETSYTRIRILGDTVITLDRLWINVIEEEITDIEIEPATKALYTLLSYPELEGKTISSIEICYYFNPEEQGILEDNTRAERGRAIPAWRIGFNDGSVKIVDNY